jgi:hypothetical protein
MKGRQRRTRAAAASRLLADPVRDDALEVTPREH